MRLAVHSARTNGGSIEAVVKEVRRVAEYGLSGYWAPMFNGQDTLTVLAIAGREVAGVELGTAVVPMPLRTPFALAQQVRTVQEATGGRLTLTLGTSHEGVTRHLFGAEWGPPLQTARRYISELRTILAGDTDRRVAGPAMPAPPVLLGAVNPAMARLAVEVASGVVTWSAGEATLRDVIGTAVRDGGGCDPFRVVASLPVAVTDDEAGTRALIHERFSANDLLPSYRKVLEREQVSGIAALSLVGTADEVRARLAAFEDCGATDFAAHVIATSAGDVDRTWELLGELSADARSGEAV